MSLIPQLTDAGKAMMVKAMTGQTLNFTLVKLGNAEAPSSVADGDYWYDMENNALYRYTESWQTSSSAIVVSDTAPSDAEEGSFWYNSTTGVLYVCSNGWVSQSVTITCSTVAPTSPSLGDYWYDTANAIFYVYKSIWNSQTTATLTVGDEEPTNPVTGDYWYSTLKYLLYVCTAVWTEETSNITISEEEPSDPSDGDYWYDTANSLLKKCSLDLDEDGESVATWSEDTTNTITVSDTAPDSPASGDWWYDTASDVLHEYDVTWDEDTAHNFSYGDTTPTDPEDGDWWYDTELHEYGPAWAPDSNQEFTYGAAAPDNPAIGDWWFDSDNKILRAYGIVWATDTTTIFTYSATEPGVGYDGDLWYDYGAEVLMEYVSGWIQDTDRTFTYSDSSPVEAATGDWWYSTSDLLLYEYSGTSWVASNVSITCSISQPNTADALTDLLNPLMECEITEILQGSNYVSLTFVLTNSDLEEGFKWCETGVFASVDDGDAELYAYCDAGELYDYIPDNTSGRVITTTFTLLVMVGDAESVTATIGEGALYATKAALSEHIRDTDNPHNTTADQVGLGNVENVAPSDMKITFDDTVSTVSELASGETTASLFSKLKAAVSALITHLKASNPHSITCTKIGAAASSHTHTLSSLSGTLPASMGGTGVTSLDALASALSSKISTTSSDMVFGWYTGDGTVKRLISLDFTPSAVFVCNGRGMVGDDVDGLCGGLAVGNRGLRIRSCTAVNHEYSWSDNHTGLMIGTNGFYVSYNASYNIMTNKSSETYRYIAFK
ncbi:MAG: hypothetical protein LUE24_14695 [Lachnospiraceae bacterium]|nr:hypothetical protein [Lachnospiraceae bacterium]